MKLTVDANIWTGRRGGLIRQGRLVIEQGRIVSVGARVNFGDVDDGEYIDASDQWLIPGLIDCHSHPVFGEAGRRYEDYIREDSDAMMLLRAAKNVQVHLAVGVTTLRDSGGRNRVTIDLRRGIERGYVSGPRVLASGRPITPTGGHFWWCNQEADGPDEVRRAVRQLNKDGADFIKIMASGGGTAGTDPTKPYFTLEELQAIVDEAHSLGLRCSAHCEATASVERAVRAGVDTIEHAGFQEPDGTRTYRPDVVEEMVARGLSYSPTIQTAYRGLDRYRGEHDVVDPRIEAARYKLTRKLENLRLMLDAGVTVVAGTDAISCFGDYVVGLELFTYAGMSPEDTLVSATSAAAKVLGLDDVGTLGAGMVADFLLIGGDPLDNIANLRRLDQIFLAGRRVEVTEAIRAALPEEALPGHRSDVAGALA